MNFLCCTFEISLSNSSDLFSMLLLQYMVAGGLASAFASTVTTPFDLIKTKLATGVLPPGTNPFMAMKAIVANEGMAGLFVGIQARLLMSSLFGGVGFAAFELCKRRLGVEETTLQWSCPTQLQPMRTVKSAGRTSSMHALR